MNRIVLVAGAAIALSASSSATADPWPQFRGAAGTGVSAESDLPVKWSADAGVRWRVNLPGRANSSPAVNSKHVVVTTTDDSGKLAVLSFDKRTGESRFGVEVGGGKLQAKGAENLWAHRHNAATPSPIVDDDHCWAYFGTGLLVCLDADDGEIVWQKDLQAEYGEYDVTFGMGSTPRLWGNALFVSCMTKGRSYVVALNKLTGDELWKADRNLDVPDDHPDAYSTPFIDERDGATTLLVAGAGHINAYDVETGRQQWICDGLSIDSPYGRVIASPVAADGIVLATAPNPGGGGLGSVQAIRDGGTGEVSESHKLWSHRVNAPDSSSPVILDGRVYLVSDNGVATCLDLKTGKSLWRQRLGSGPYHAATIAGDGKVYFLSIDGKCTVVQAGDGGDVLATNTLPGTFYATPAVSDGVLYLRSYEALYAVDGS